MTVWRYAYSLEGTEFSGGRLTGLLLNMKTAGALLFVLAGVMIFFYRRIAAAITILASLLCLPFYLYFAAPGPFRSVFGGEYSVPLGDKFVLDARTVFGILLFAITTFVSLRTLLISKDSNPPA